MDDQDQVMSDRSYGDDQLLGSIEQYDDYDLSEVSSVLSDPPSDLDWQDATTTGSKQQRTPCPVLRRPKGLTKARQLKLASSPVPDPDIYEDKDSDVVSYYNSDDNSSADGQSSSDEDDSKELNKKPLDNFYALKIDSTVSKFENVPHEVA
jgi:hypothetical protein